MQIAFSVSGMTQLSRNLRIVADGISRNGMKDFHSDAIDKVEEKSLEIFEKGGQNVKKSPKWKPLAPSTKNARQKRWGYYKKTPIATNKPLIWTGNLMNSRKKIATKDFGQLSFTAPYAQYHQQGGGNLPQRAIIDFDNNLNTEIVRILQGIVDRELGIFGRQV